MINTGQFHIDNLDDHSLNNELSNKIKNILQGIEVVLVAKEIWIETGRK